MTISFQNIPQNLRVPLFYAEVNNSQANTATEQQRALIIGQITPAGKATAGVPQLLQGAADAKSQGGSGSMLALMAAAYAQNDPLGEVWALSLADDPAAVAASGTLTLTGQATAPGSLALYVAGQLVSLPVTTTQTVASIATALAGAINGVPDVPVTAAANAGVVTLTAKNKGLAGNDIDIRLNYRGAASGEVTPAGLQVAIVAMANGATNPQLAGPLATLGDLPFDFIVSPYTDAASVAALSALLNDQAGRWSWDIQVYGHVFMAMRGTTGQLATYGATQNDQHTSCMGFYDSPTPNFVWAAAFAGAAAVSLKADPGVPLQTVQVRGVLAPPLASRFPLGLRNTLLFDGISTFTVDQAGNVSIENAITTYQKNALGQADNSYLEVETMFLLAFVLRSLASVVRTKYARVKLAADGTRFQPGSNVVTPSVIRADIIAQYRTLESGGFVQNSSAFAQALQVVQNAQNPNRVDVLWPVTLIAQLRIFALLAQFRLS